MSDDTWYSRNKEKAKASARAYQAANKEKFKAYFKDYYQKNKDKLRETHKVFAQKNRARLNQLNREVYGPRYRARKLGAPEPPLLPLSPMPPVADPIVREEGSFTLTFE